MRDPLVRGVSAGLILALPILIHVVSATSSAASPSGTPLRSISAVASLGLAEAVVGVGLWLAGHARRRLASADPIDLNRTAFATALNADPFPG
jgi:hypothetical protein